MLRLGLVCHNLVPPLALLLKGLKAEKCSSTFPVRLCPSASLYFSFIVSYFSHKITSTSQYLQLLYMPRLAQPYVTPLASVFQNRKEWQSLYPHQLFPSPSAWKPMYCMGTTIGGHPNKGRSRLVWNQGTINFATDLTWQSRNQSKPVNYVCIALEKCQLYPREGSRLWDSYIWYNCG